MQRSSIDQSVLEMLEINMSPLLTSQKDIEQETQQSFISKDDLTGRFRPFQNERDSTGRLIHRAKSNVSATKINFLKSQQMIVQSASSNNRTKNPAYKWSTTNLLGLKQKQVNPTENPISIKQQLKYFKINLQADQGFIKQFREYKKQYIPKTQLTRAFLTPTRDQFYRENKFPGPGVYSDQLLTTDPGQSIEFNKSPQFVRYASPICGKDFYDCSPKLKNDNVPDFERTISREGAYQKGIFAQIELQQRENMKLQKPEVYNEQKINREIEYLIYQQQKYGKWNYQKILDSNNQIKKITQPEILHTNWNKMLDRYGFKRIKGGKLTKQRIQTTSNL